MDVWRLKRCSGPSQEGARTKRKKRRSELLENCAGRCGANQSELLVSRGNEEAVRMHTDGAGH